MRRQVRRSELLNRWIVPLEKRLDCSTLATGNEVDSFNSNHCAVCASNF